MPVHHKVVGAAKTIGSKVATGAKELGQSSVIGISAAKESIEGVVAPTSAQIQFIYPTEKGRKYLADLQARGDEIATNEDSWVFQLLSPGPGGQGWTTAAYINSMMSEHNYQGDRNQLAKNINEMLASGDISGTPPEQVQEVPVETQPIEGIAVGPELPPEQQVVSSPPTASPVSGNGQRTTNKYLPGVELGRLIR